MPAKSLRKRIIENIFWVSLLLHLLLLLAFLLVLDTQPQEQQQKQSQLYVPSYIYRGAITPASAPIPRPRSLASQSTQSKQTKSIEKTVQPDVMPEPAKIAAMPTAVKPQTIAVGKTPNVKRASQASSSDRPKSLFSASTEMLHQEQMRAITNRSDEEPILLIGDTTKIADPLIKLMARSLSAHFRYPETEGMMGIKGRVLVLITLHPEGYYSDVEMVKSSESPNLDAAALYAVNTAPQVYGASTFIKQPKRFLVGFVFE